MKTRIAMLALLVLGLPSFSARALALDPAAQAGVDYLVATQNGDGSWGGTPTSLTSKLHGTAEIVDSLRALGETGSPTVANATAFLGAQTPSITELIGRKVIALSGLANTSPEVTSLLGRQNGDGGWGAGIGFESNVLDTALALRALHAAGLPPGLIVEAQGISAGTPHLLAVDVPVASTQLRIVVTALTGVIDVRIRQGSPPPITDPFFHLTAAPVQIVLTPASFPQLVAGTNFIRIDAAAAATYSLEVSVIAPAGNGAVTLAGARFLLDARNADGGWGLFPADGDSRVFFSAEAAIGLLSVTPLDATVSFLTARHRADGGFGDLAASTAFETALALRVLLPLGVDPSGFVPSPVGYLQSAQLGNGSWVDDGYSTGLAIRAVQDASGPTCGDGVVSPGEDCDGANLGGATCATLGLGGGTLTCSASCTYVTTGCTGPSTTTTSSSTTTTSSSSSTTVIGSTTTSTSSSTSTSTSSSSSTTITSTSSTTSSTTTTLPGFAIDHFVLYKVKAGTGSPKFASFAPVTLADQFGASSYQVVKPRLLGLPADKNGEGVIDASTHLREFQVKAVKGAPPFASRSDVQIANQCSALRLVVSKVDSILVPARKSLVSPPAAPSIADHELDHYLCYKAKPQTKLADGTPLPKFPKGIQVVVADQFQSRRYDLKKIKRLCNPVDKSGNPVVVSGANAGQPFPITASPIRHPADHLVCYQAKLAAKLIPQTGCGPITPGDAGTPIVPKQGKHTPVTPLFVNDDFGAELLASVREAELCIPSTKTP